MKSNNKEEKIKFMNLMSLRATKIRSEGRKTVYYNEKNEVVGWLRQGYKGNFEYHIE